MLCTPSILKLSTRNSKCEHFEQSKRPTLLGLDYDKRSDIWLEALVGTTTQLDDLSDFVNLEANQPPSAIAFSTLPTELTANIEDSLEPKPMSQAKAELYGRLPDVQLVVDP
jgi:hypothetical protein